MFTNRNQKRSIQIEKFVVYYYIGVTYPPQKTQKERKVTAEMKMRVICYSKKKKMEGYCEAIANAQGCKWDKLPLAYPCDKERLTIFVASLPNDDLSRMVPEMTKERSANVAFLVDGPEGSANELIETAKKAGTNVIDKVMYVKCGAISFLDKIKEDDKAKAKAWAEEIIAAMK